MSVTRAVAIAAAAAAAVGIGATSARAQSNFVPDDEEETAREKRETKYDIRLTSTTFGYRETGAIGPALGVGTEQPDNASPIDRVFTDLRAQVTGTHVSGSKWDYRLDTRFRLNQDTRPTSNVQDDAGNTIPIQSGTFGGNTEIDLRELYFKRRGRKTDWVFGRQMVLDLAATKIDGVRVEYEKDDEWTYIGFGGFYPVRGSRSIKTDYPTEQPDPLAADPTAPGPRVMPVAVGGGGAYRFARAFGAIGAGAIIARTEAEVGGQQEKPRVFVTSNGYWRKSNTLDLYHYLVFDLDAEGLDQASSDDFCKGRCRNVLLGAAWHPRFSFRVNASVNMVNTETLNAHAKTRLEEPDQSPLAGPRIQNNVEVLRIASQSGRLSVSNSFKDMRYEVTATGQLRRRPEFNVTGTDGTIYTFPRSQAADVTLGVTDRRFYFGLRLYATITSIFGVGAENLNRTEAKVFRIGGAKELNDGRTEVEADISYLTSTDDNQGMMATTCGIADAVDPFNCYGTSNVKTLQAGGLVFHQLNPKWFVVGSAYLGRQRLQTADAMGTRVNQPLVTTLTAFLRLDYKFR
jgi:hypothetical protein